MENNNFLKNLKDALDGNDDATNSSELLDKINELKKITNTSELIDNKLRDGDITLDELKNKQKTKQDLLDPLDPNNYQSIDTDYMEIKSDKIKSQIIGDLLFAKYANLSNMLWEFNKIREDYKEKIKTVFFELKDNPNSTELILKELEDLNKNYNIEEFINN